MLTQQVEKNKNNLLSLPRDVILYIFALCSPTELLLLTRVSKPVANIASDERIWRPLVATLFNQNQSLKQPYTNYKDVYKNLALIKLNELQTIAANLQTTQSYPGFSVF